MSSIPGNPALAPSTSNTALERLLPEPKSRLSIDFRSVLNGVLGAVSGGVSGVSGIDPSYVQLLNKQIETQQQMQLVTMESNVEKSRHETLMSAIRNVRVA